jgi:NAD-dependent DNA ligase
LALFLVDSLNAFDIEGVSTKNALKLAEAGLDSLPRLWTCTQAQLISVVGNALGAKLYEQLHKKIPAASPERWIAAYQGWPRGFGKQRIASLLALAPVEAWSQLKAPPRGMGEDSFASTIGCVGGFLAWRADLGWTEAVSAQGAQVQAQATPIVKVGGQSKGGVCMTGFRDELLAMQLASVGWELHDTVKKATKVLIVGDESGMGTTKVAAAREKGVRIILRKDVSQLK